MSNVLSIRALTAPAPATTQSLFLHGAIITPTGFIPDGTVVVNGDRITAVHATRTSPTDGSREIETNGLMSPGFVDTHNHAPYAAFRRWAKPARYLRSRFDWRGKTRCKVVVVPEPDDFYLNHVSKPFKEVTRKPEMLPQLTLYGQVRGLIGGATTMVIDADLDPNAPRPLPGFSRDPSDWPGRVWGILDVGCVDPAQQKAITDDLTAGKAKLLAHIGEGVDEFSRGEFMTLEAKGLLTQHTALIHAMALLESDWQLVKQRGTSVIWSPRSNYRLYGRSIDIGQVIGAGIPVALAPDWTITGSSTVLDELAFVRGRYGWIPDELLLRMVTESAADIMGMPALGRIEANALADILVFPRDGVTDRASAARRVVTSTHGDLQLAMIAGLGAYGTVALMELCPTGGATNEPIEVPVSDGTSVTRILRIGSGPVYATAVGAISAELAAQNLTIAPLWEAD